MCCWRFKNVFSSQTLYYILLFKVKRSMLYRNHSLRIGWYSTTSVLKTSVLVLVLASTAGVAAEANVSKTH